MSKKNHPGINQKPAIPSAEALELDRINSALRGSGLEYPLGYRGVRDLISLADSKHALVEQFSKDIQRANELRKKAEAKAIELAKERDAIYEANREMMAERGDCQPVNACDHPNGFIGRPSMCGSCGEPNPMKEPFKLDLGEIRVEEEAMEDEGAFGYNAYAPSINDIEEEMSGLRGRLKFLRQEVNNYSVGAHLPHYFANDGDGSPLRCVRCGEHEEGLLSENATCPGYNLKAPHRVQLVVQHNDGHATFHDSKGGWKIDSTNRTLLIGKGLGRVLVPLDNVRYFSPEAY